MCVRLQAGTDFELTPTAAAVAFDGDPMTAWCPAALPVTVELALAERTSFASSFVEVLGGNFASKQELARHGRLRTFRLSVEDLTGASTTTSGHLAEPSPDDLALSVAYPPRIELASPTSGAFVRRLTLVLDTVWPGQQADACVSEIAVRAIPWSANPENEDVPPGSGGLTRQPPAETGATGYARAHALDLRDRRQRPPRLRRRDRHG